jgi:DNA-binding transcriptional LysR family regulator
LFAAKGSGCAPSGLALAALREVPMILREQGSGTAKAVNEALAEAGFDPAGFRARLRVGSTEAAKAAMLCGLGAAFLSELAVSREMERGDAVEIEVEGLKIARTFYLVRRHGVDSSGAMQLFWDSMTAAGVCG